ncbi:MAG: CoA transferase [Chloroflexi bacterium]|nr:CoA transferase [Chloroflexota bacterium]
MQGEDAPRMLSPYRVLDLADEAGILAGKILADLGADVVAVEPPQGNPVRRLGPFYQGQPHPEHSLVWWAYAAGKRSISLNLQSSDGRALLIRLAATADFLLESFPPGQMDHLGIGYETLKEVNPRLIMASMTPFGQDGPCAHYEGPDLVGMALGGFMHLTGDPDRPPLRITEPQFGRHIGASGAAGAMVAHHYRLLTGRGQHVDISGQQAVARTLAHAPSYWDLNKTSLRRQGAYRPGAEGFRGRVTWPCKDGYVNFMVSAGPLGAGSNALMRWMDQEGFGDDFLRSLDWTKLESRDMTEQFRGKVDPTIERFFLTKPKQELYQEGALARRMLLFPVNTLQDIREQPQLEARRFFVQVQHSEEGASIAYPGGFIRSSATTVGPQRRAPLLGEHNRDVYVGELGLGVHELVALRRTGVV